MNLSAAIWAVRAQFFFAGFLFATWGVHVPSVKSTYTLGEQTLAIAMLAAGVGSVAALTQAGRWVGRHGARQVTWLAGSAVAASLGLLLFGGSYVPLLVILLVFGMGMSLWDVAINTAASELEGRTGRSLMSAFHGMFSLGGMAGAALGSALVTWQVRPGAHLIGVAVCAAILIAVCARPMLTTAAGAAAAAAEGHGFAIPRGVLALLGVLAALGLIAEGAMYDWSVLYMTQELASDADTAALAYASFSGAMAAARFGGDWVRERVRAETLVSGCGAMAAVGMAVVLWVADPVVALIGFAVVGLGFANIVPVLFSSAAKQHANPAQGIAMVASMGYLGMMAGPPLIGVIAEYTSLTTGLTSVVLFAAILALAAPRALRPAR